MHAKRRTCDDNPLVFCCSQAISFRHDCCLSCVGLRQTRCRVTEECCRFFVANNGNESKSSVHVRARHLSGPSGQLYCTGLELMASWAKAQEQAPGRYNFLLMLFGLVHVLCQRRAHCTQYSTVHTQTWLRSLVAAVACTAPILPLSLLAKCKRRLRLTQACE